MWFIPHFPHLVLGIEDACEIVRETGINHNARE